MAKRPAGEPPKKSSDSRREKLAAELRANLKKRKDQIRQRSTPANSENPSDQNASPNNDE